jgi:hypothetical protein
MQAGMESLAARPTRLRQQLEQMPERNIPELKFLTEKHWLNVAGDVDKLEVMKISAGRCLMCTRERKLLFGEKMRKALRVHS